jgi:DNA-binding IclR family transcriptional regulator
MLGTIQKASDVLDLFTEEKPEWGVTEIATLTSEPKSTVHELLASLAQIGWLSRTDRGRYRLGLRLLSFSRAALSTFPFRDEARRRLQDLADRFNEISGFSILDGFEVVNIEGARAHFRREQALAPIGMRVPASHTAFGKVLLAHKPWDWVQAECQKQGLRAITPNSVTHVEHLKNELEQIRQNGHAVCVGEWVLEWSDVAAPVRDRNGTVFASLGFTIPTSRFPSVHESVVAAVLEEANALSRSMNYAVPVAATPAILGT